MLKNKTNKKVQHYVPQFYLRGFVDPENKLHCVKIDNGDSFTAHTRDICQSKYHYEIEWEDAKIRSDMRFMLKGKIEDYFSKFEYDFAPVLKSIVKKCKTNANAKSLICTTSEYNMLCKMICNLIVRNPYTLNTKHFEDEKRRLLETDDIKELDRLVKLTKIGDVATSIKYVQKTNHYGMDRNDSVFKKLISDLSNLKYTFLFTDDSLITSDCPVIYSIDSDNLSMAYLPLSPNVAVAFGNTDMKCRNRCSKLEKADLLKCNGQYIDYELATTLISNKPFCIDDFKRVNKQ